MSISKYKLVLFIFVGNFGTYPGPCAAAISPGPLHRRKGHGSPQEGKKNRPGDHRDGLNALCIFLHAIRKHQKREEDHQQHKPHLYRLPFKINMGNG